MCSPCIKNSLSSKSKYASQIFSLRLYVPLSECLDIKLPSPKISYIKIDVKMKFKHDSSQSLTSQTRNARMFNVGVWKHLISKSVESLTGSRALAAKAIALFRTRGNHHWVADSIKFVFVSVFCNLIVITGRLIGSVVRRNQVDSIHSS